MGLGFDNFDKHHINIDSTSTLKIIKLMSYQDFKI